MTQSSAPRIPRSFRSQRGVATLLVTLSILVILTIIILASSNVALFEQKTATNEYRARLAEQAAEYALSIGGEYLKANVSKVSTNVAGGWLNGASLHWKSCAGITDTTHVCFAEPDPVVRAKMYYYTNDGNPHTAGSDAGLDLFAQINGTTLLPAGSLTSVGGTASFPATATVKALLCRINSPTGFKPACALSPTSGRQIAITLVSEGKLTDENSSAVVKETWGSINKSSFSASVPLVASGFIQFVGNFTVVAAPNAGGYGVVGSVWSPNDVDGNGSYQSCHRDDYLNGLPYTELATDPGCADNSSCDCDTEILSSKAAGDGEDVLDVDSNTGPNPDITFFPGKNSTGTRMDYRACTSAGAPYADCVAAGACSPSHPSCFTDDNLFEWIFGVDTTGVDGSGNDDNVTDDTCAYAAWSNGGTATVAAGTNCELSALHDLNFQAVPDCDGLSATSSGLYYVTGTCSLPSVVGSPDHPVVVVVNDSMTIGHSDLFYGMMFVRDQTLDKSSPVDIKGNAKGMFFGSVVVEGGGRLNGTMDLVYLDTSAGSPDDPLPDSTRFARLPGSWLDNQTSF
jgi:hypothetical protein